MPRAARVVLPHYSRIMSYNAVTTNKLYLLSRKTSNYISPICAN